MAVIAGGQHAPRQLHFDLVADALAEQGAAERRIHADVAGLAVEFVRARRCGDGASRRLRPRS